jgi:hypothetical protein
MRSRLIITASALALLAAPALAQTSSPSPPPAGGLTTPRTMTPTTPPGAPANAPAAVAARTPAPDPLTMEDTAQIKGSTVYGSDDKKIGAVSAVLMQPQNKTIDRLVVNEGGLLGVGGHRVALPLSDFKWSSDKDAFTIGKTADELKSMPEWKAASAGSVPIEQSSSGSSTRPPMTTAPAGSLPAPSNAGTSSGSTTE